MLRVRLGCGLMKNEALLANFSSIKKFKGFPFPIMAAGKFR